MAMGIPSRSSVDAYLARIVDATVYAVVVAMAGCLVSGIAGILILGSLNGTKFLLFVLGFLQIGVGVARLWPTDVSDIEGGPESNPDDPSRVQLVVDRIAPTERLGLPPNERFERGGKQLLAGVLLLVVSFSMEAVFGITG